MFASYNSKLKTLSENATNNLYLCLRKKIHLKNENNLFWMLTIKVEFFI
jgi:hypothetical protein